ncbi:MAG: sigma-70 family RNA polymerase sigma factor [Acidobacteriota bacterium]
MSDSDGEILVSLQDGGLRQDAGEAAPEDPSATARIVRDLQRGVNLEAGFRNLFDRYYWPLYRSFRRRGFSEEETRDLVQDVFVGVHQSVATYRWEAPFEAWLLGLARNAARKRLRVIVHRRSGRELPLETTLDGEPIELPTLASDDPLADFLRLERGDALRTAVADLPPRMRACVQLWLERDLSYVEIAEVLQIAEDTVKVHMFQARKRLRQALRPANDERRDEHGP